MTIINACELRVTAFLHTVPEQPGWYRWWTPENACVKLFNDYWTRLKTVLTKGAGDTENHYYVYVGVAIKESVRARLNWHINQKHSHSAIKHGTLSTLRQSIASLVSGSMSEENSTNELIDMLKVEYFSLTLGIRSDEAKKKIHAVENGEMEKHVLPLNIMGNCRSETTDFKTYLKAQRKMAKAF